MRIGELAECTGTTARLLRYYEEQHLMTPERSPNGYREYDESFVSRVMQIKGLLDAGLPTRIIRQVLPCLDELRIHFTDATPEMLATLADERDRMSERITVLTRNRDAVAHYLQAVGSGGNQPCRDVPEVPEPDDAEPQSWLAPPSTTSSAPVV